MMQAACALSFSTPVADAGPALTVRLASSAREIEQACRLRYQVFVEEPGVEPLYNAAGIERDALDASCDHLIVKDHARDIVVATYRMLPGTRAAGMPIYTESEFELNAFRAEMPRTLELARSCVHPGYRGGQAVRMLWEGMLRYYFARETFHYLIGCASLRVDDIDDLNIVYSHFLRQPYACRRFGIRPKPGLRVPGLRDVGPVNRALVQSKLPAMIKAYLRIGAEVVADPIYDPIFRTYDFCMIIPKGSLPRAYQRKFGPR
jgi:putative hemolysin